MLAARSPVARANAAMSLRCGGSSFSNAAAWSCVRNGSLIHVDLSDHRCQTHSRVGERAKHSVAKSKKREKVTPMSVNCWSKWGGQDNLREGISAKRRPRTELCERRSHRHGAVAAKAGACS